MRTTIFLKPELAKRLKPLAMTKKLSDFINQCIEEHYATKMKRELEMKLAEAYDRANEEGAPITKEFLVTETEDWPAW